jgi:hypothetical protein
MLYKQERKIKQQRLGLFSEEGDDDESVPSPSTEFSEHESSTYEFVGIEKIIRDLVWEWICADDKKRNLVRIKMLNFYNETLKQATDELEFHENEENINQCFEIFSDRQFQDIISTGYMHKVTKCKCDPDCKCEIYRHS